MCGRVHVLSCAVALIVATGVTARQTSSRSERQQIERLERIRAQEGEALLELADAAMSGKPVPADFALEFHHDFLKAQQGTFVPFVVTFDATELATPAVLLYVRAVPRHSAPDLNHPPFETVYPVAVGDTGAERVRVVRGFAVPAGEYDVCLVVRERVDPQHPSRVPKAAVHRQSLSVPDFRVDELMTSSIILAGQQGTLTHPVPPELQQQQPYAIGLTDIQPSTDHRFRQYEELIVVFLVYNTAVTPEKKFDLEVEYHFFLRDSPAGLTDDDETPAAVRALRQRGERYFNHTRPQRLTPAVMEGVDPAVEHPVMAGQGVPLAGFPEGHYRLAIRITDAIAGKTITRDVTFAVAR